MEKLSYNDAFVMEIVVDKINEIIDYVEKTEEILYGRIDAHWKYHRYLNKRIEEMEKILGIYDGEKKDPKPNGNKAQ